MASTLQGGGAAATIVLDVTHESYPEMRWAELRFDKRMHADQIKEKLEKHVGCSAEHMKLYLICGGDNEQEERREMHSAEDGGALGEYIAAGYARGATHMRLHVDDRDPSSVLKALQAAAAQSDPSKRYRMSDEAYESRGDTARQFLKDMKSRNPELFEKKENATANEGDAGMSVEEAKIKYPLDARCRVLPGDRRGNVKFVGELEKPTAGTRKRELVIGVVLDEPLGDSDGSHPQDPKRTLVDCAGEGYATFAKPQDVEVGDFPAFDPFELDEV